MNPLEVLLVLIAVFLTYVCIGYFTFYFLYKVVDFDDDFGCATGGVFWPIVWLTLVAVVGPVMALRWIHKKISRRLKLKTVVQEVK